MIDYYYGDAAAKLSMVPKLHHLGSVQSIAIDVQPALDSPDALADRVVRMALRIPMSESDYRLLPFSWQPKAPPSLAARPWT